MGFLGRRPLGLLGGERLNVRGTSKNTSVRARHSSLLLLASAASLTYTPAGGAAFPVRAVGASTGGAPVRTGPSDTTGKTGAIGATGSTRAGDSSRGTGPIGSSPTPVPPVTSLLYRPVGCVASGPTRALTTGPARKVVAIGFDDGPARDTAAFVRMLERAHTQATFFVIGEQLAPSYRSLLLRELRDGDVVGDHSFTHPFLTRTGNVRSELSRTLGRIRKLSGYTPCIFRPPYGDYNKSVIREARALGMATVLWDVDPSDYRLPGTAAVERRVLSGVRPGSIILSHDGGGPRGQTLAAYPHIIAALRARGYRIETIPQLLGYRPIYQRCARSCDGLGVVRERVPDGALVRGLSERERRDSNPRPPA